MRHLLSALTLAAPAALAACDRERRRRVLGAEPERRGERCADGRGAIHRHLHSHGSVHAGERRLPSHVRRADNRHRGLSGEIIYGVEPPARPFTRASAGNLNTCALEANGAVTCWGFDGSGAVSGSPTPDEPVTVTRPGPYSQVSVGGGEIHTCALETGGGFGCWGANPYGQVGGPPTTTDPPAAAYTHPGPFTQVSAGGAHTCALKPNSTAVNWGTRPA